MDRWQYNVIQYDHTLNEITILPQTGTDPWNILVRNSIVHTCELDWTGFYGELNQLWMHDLRRGARRTNDDLT